MYILGAGGTVLCICYVQVVMCCVHVMGRG